MTQVTPYIERAPRFPLHLTLRYRRTGTDSWQNGRTINISRTGILFYAEDHLSPDSLLEMEVSFPSEVMMRCQGSLVRSEGMHFAVSLHRYQIRSARKGKNPVPSPN